jgi:N-acetylmuramoyl-L-alanine amidase
MMKILFGLIVACLLAACATPPIDTSYQAKSQDSRAQFLVLHYTAQDFPTALKTLTEGPVSAHYLVQDDPPTIYRLVDETRRAWHAGVSSWQGTTQLNAASIGIEIVNPGFRDSPQGRVWFDYPQPQIDAVIALVKKIVAEHHIRPDHIVGHSDIAPQRKTDPGPRFPWKQLADAGLIPWPDAALVAAKKAVYEQQLPDIEWFQRRLARHGFATPLNGELDEATVRILAAFQMKYRPAQFDGMPDAETAALLDVLTSKTP